MPCFFEPHTRLWSGLHAPCAWACVCERSTMHTTSIERTMLDEGVLSLKNQAVVSTQRREKNSGGPLPPPRESEFPTPSSVEEGQSGALCVEVNVGRCRSGSVDSVVVCGRCVRVTTSRMPISILSTELASPLRGKRKDYRETELRGFLPPTPGSSLSFFCIIRAKEGGTLPCFTVHVRDGTAIQALTLSLAV